MESKKQTKKLGKYCKISKYVILYKIICKLESEKMKEEILKIKENALDEINKGVPM